MRRFLLAVTVTLCCLSLVDNVLAQERPGRRGMRFRFGGMMFRMGKLMLLRSEAVQKELKLTEDQKEMLRDVGEEMRQKMQGLRDLEPEQRFVEMRKIMRSADEMVDAILEPEQAKRLNQISLQASLHFVGARVFLRPDVAKELGLTDEQKEALEKIVEEQREQFGGGRFDFSRFREMSREERREFFRKMEEEREKARKEALEKAMQVLTDEQKEKWQAMLGEPFDVEQLRTFGPGRGFRGGFGPGRRGRGGDRAPGRSETQ